MADGELVTPRDVELEMIELTRRISAAPGVIRDSYNRLKAAQADYRKAYAIAYAEAEGTIADKKVEAEISTEPQRDAMDVAEVEHRYLVDTMDSLKTKLRALQSIGSLMRAEMFNSQGGV